MKNKENKGGRPKQEYTRESRFELRLGNGDIMLLDILVEKTGKSKAEILRDGLQLAYCKEMGF